MTLEEQIRQAQEAERSNDQGKKSPDSTTEPAGQVSLQTADGRTISGSNYEELAKKLAAEKPQVVQVEKPVQQPRRGDEPPQWSDDEFANRFVKNPREGLQFYEQTTYGFDPRQVVPTLVAAVQQLAIKNQQAEAREFMKENKDFEKGDGSNFQAMIEIAQQRGYNLNTAEALTDAWTLAKAYGLAKPKGGRSAGGDEEPVNRMPHGRRSGGGDLEPANQLDALNNLSDESLDALFNKNRGGIAAALGGRDRGEDF